MKKAKLLLLTLGLAASVPITSKGETKTPYELNFDTQIVTVSHDFRPASNWRHIVESFTSYSQTYYVDYYWYGTGGVEDSGYLRAGNQIIGDSWDTDEQLAVNDLLVTPVINGEVSFAAKRFNYSGYLTVYAINEDGSRGAQLQRYSSELSSDEWRTMTFTLDEPQRIGIKMSYTGIDNFKAGSAELEVEKSLSVDTAQPIDCDYSGNGQSGTIYWFQQPDGNVKVSYTVTVTNNGEAALTQGDENFSVSIFDRKTGNVFVTVPVPQDLAVGDTSEPFEVTAMVPASNWPNSYTYINMDVRENLMGSTLIRTQSNFRAYEPKFVLREAGTTSTSSLSSAISFGMVSEPVTKNLEIFNDGVAPLTIKSVTLPAGFTTDLAETGEFVLAKKTGIALNITISTANRGTFAGDLVIVYLDKDGAEQTKTLPLSATVLGANTWFATFDNPEGTSTVAYPEGSIAEGGIQSDYTYNSSTKSYDIYLKSYTSTSYQNENNKFITPKLRAQAGDVLSFDVARDGTNTSYSMKVYVSTDRVNWGEPVATYVPNDMGGTAFVNKSITFDQAGEYYVGFAIYGMRLNNVAGLEKVEATHDIYIKNVIQDETVQGGMEFTSGLVIIPLTTEDADAYTVNFFVNNESVMTIPSLALTASANRETRFNAKWTPEVEQTVTVPTYFEIAFTDGTKFTSPVKNVTVEFQPEFVFFDKDNYAGPNYKPDSRKAPIKFGKINTTGIKQECEIYNWGAAPLVVKSITLPEGFAATVTDEEGNTTPVSAVTVPAKSRQGVDIVLTATEAGTYSGNLSIVYVDVDGTDATFELPVSAVLLDTSKWYASFDDGTNSGVWPAGSVHQRNVNLTNTGSYTEPAVAIYSQSTTDNLFVTPKLHVATAGETLAFDAKAYDSNYYNGILKVYYAATREGLENDEQRVLLGTYTKDSQEEATLLDKNNFKTFTVALPEPGDFYIGFVMENRAYVDDIYGLSLANVAHDLQLAASLIPANAVQNTMATANLAVRNFGTNVEAADAYTLTAYVNGEPQTIEGYKEIPVVDTYTAATTSFDIPFRSPKAGTFPVYLEFKAGDFVLTTEPQDVVFAEETLSNEIVVGTYASTSNKTPLNLYYKNSETVALYTPAELGLNGGEKIVKIAMKGYMKKAGYTSDLKFYYQWTDDAEQPRPATDDAYDFSGMTQVIDQASYEWPAIGSDSERVEMLVINFPEPEVYQAGKSLRLFVRSTASTDAGNNQFAIEASSTKKNTYQHQNDGTKDVFTGSWSSVNDQALPVLYISLDVTPISISGNVTDTEGNAAEGATVTLVSTDGDNIQYEGTTDATGAYSVNVIQSNRVYDIIVTKDGKEDFADAVEFAESKTTDFTLYEVAELNDQTNGVTAIESALVKIDLGLKPGFNAIALPVALTSDEVAALFGEDAKVYEFVSVDGELDALAHFFAKTDGMEAGVPYLLEIAEAPAPIKVKGRAVVTDAPSVAHYAVDFTATYAPMAVNDGMFFLTADNYVATTAAASHGLSFADNDETATTLPAFRAYVKAREGRELQTFRFDILTDYTGIEGVASDLDENDEIYNLQGIRVKNPARGGVYIVNGKKVLVK